MSIDSFFLLGAISGCALIVLIALCSIAGYRFHPGRAGAESNVLECEDE